MFQSPQPRAHGQTPPATRSGTSTIPSWSWVFTPPNCRRVHLLAPWRRRRCSWIWLLLKLMLLLMVRSEIRENNSPVDMVKHISLFTRGLGRIHPSPVVVVLLGFSERHQQVVKFWSDFTDLKDVSGNRLASPYVFTWIFSCEVVILLMFSKMSNKFCLLLDPNSFLRKSRCT